MLKYGWLFITFSFFCFLMFDNVVMEVLSFGACVVAIVMGKRAASLALKALDTDGDGELSEQELTAKGAGGKVLHGAAGAMLAKVAIAQLAFMSLWVALRSLF